MNIGFHITQDTFKLSYKESAAKFASMGLKACQIFVANPRSGKLIKMNGDFPINTHAHSSYLCHMCNGSHFIKQELKHADDLGCKSLVVHLERQPFEKNVEAARGLLHWRQQNGIKTMILFENNGVKKCQWSWEDPDKLRAFVEALADYDGYGLCIDTSHLWVSGVNVTSEAVMQSWLDQVPKIMLFHLNDNANPIGGHDVHSPLAEGQIWRHDQGGIRAVIQFAIKHQIDVVLERGGDFNPRELELILRIGKK